MIADLVTVLFLVFMEGVLSIDNALVLAVMVRHLPLDQRRKALTYGIWGAFGFRVLSLFILNFLMENVWVKFLGGAYLLYISIRHFISGDADDQAQAKSGSFLQTILTVELMDIAFSADSILASVAVSPRYWIVLTGGILGIIMMRFAAILFIKLLERFPRFESTAYLLVFTIGAKLVAEGFHIDFHSGRWFYLFWGAMATFILLGFLPNPAQEYSELE